MTRRSCVLGFSVVVAFATLGCKSPFDEGAKADGGTAESEFSFFYTSLSAMQRLSGSEQGFGGDLRYGGATTGIEGADNICQKIAEDEGSTRTWRAFLSATQGSDGHQVDAISRIGTGPWYDRKGRLIAEDLGGLTEERPLGDPDAVNDLPDETGNGTSSLGTSYDVITGSNKIGTLYTLTGAPDPRDTCNDWTDATLVQVAVMCGHTWLAGGLGNWIEAHPERSCVPGFNLESDGAGDGSSIGSAGGWGGFYCFALSP